MGVPRKGIDVIIVLLEISFGEGGGGLNGFLRGGKMQ